jgi:hypothetical protein
MPPPYAVEQAIAHVGAAALSALGPLFTEQLMVPAKVDHSLVMGVVVRVVAECSVSDRAHAPRLVVVRVDGGASGRWCEWMVNVSNCMKRG